MCDGKALLELKRLLTTISSFEVQNFMKLLPPHSQKGFKQPQRDLHTTLSKCSYDKPFPILFDVKQSCFSNRSTGAVSTRNSSASVIGAFWPGHGRSLSDIIYDKLKIGIIQYFFSHKISLTYRDSEAHQIKEVEHIFCYVKWCIEHSKSDWFGISAVMCTTLTEFEGPVSFLPLCVVCRCAHGKLKVDMGMLGSTHLN